MSPRVTVIVPVYNAVDFVEESLRSVLQQTMAGSEVQLIVVDDGSTDGSDLVLERIKAEHPSMELISQQNSGSPGGARNPALDRAAGEYVFFLDSDDYLAPDALRRMAEVADREGSDVVLCRLAGIGGRRPPSAMFKETVLDAPLLESGIFGALGPTKLIRRSLIERSNLRFPTALQVGEDQSFVATLYLTARKITILADMDYYFVRLRDDGGNISRSSQPASTHLLRATLLAQVIEKYTDPGSERDGLLHRPFGRSMEKGLQGRWLQEAPERQADLAESARRDLAKLYTDAVRLALPLETRTKIDLLFAGDLDGLRKYIEFEATGQPRVVYWQGGAFHVRYPVELAAHLSEDQLIAPEPRITARLDAVEVSGTATRIRIALDLHEYDGGPDRAVVLVKHRQTHRVIEFDGHVGEPGQHGDLVFVDAVLDGLARGVWDVSIRVDIGAFEKALRVGRDRLPSVDPDGTSNLDASPRADDRVIAYFTKGRSYLSIDRGAVLHAGADRARVLGFVLDENARCAALVQVNRPYVPSDEYFGHVEGVHNHAGRLLLPVTQIGERLLSVRLPFDDEWVGATMKLTAVLDGAQSSLHVTGTEYWSARPSGYGLTTGAEGEVRVVEVIQQPWRKRRSRRPAPVEHVRVDGPWARAKAGVKRIAPAAARRLRVVRGKSS